MRAAIGEVGGRAGHAVIRDEIRRNLLTRWSIPRSTGCFRADASAQSLMAAPQQIQTVCSGFGVLPSKFLLEQFSRNSANSGTQNAEEVARPVG